MIARVEWRAEVMRAIGTWAIPASMIVVIEYLFALGIGYKVGFHYSIPTETYAVVGASIGFGCVAGAVLVLLASFALKGEPNPSERLLAYWPRFAAFIIGVLLVTGEMAVLMWLKVEMPLSVGFWADRFLADTDHALFKVDPWRITHFTLDWASPLLDRAYVTWAPAKFATLIFVLATPESWTKTRAIQAYFLTVATGTLGQYILPSAGPIFYSRLGLGDRFADLPILPWVEVTRAYLWRDYLNAGGLIGGGISAMPSLHVAVATWIALTLGSYFPRLGPIFWCFPTLIFIGSIHLGWHYAADAIAGVSIALLGWWLAIRIGRTYSIPSGAAQPLTATPALEND